jgi:outer membrane lipopolysaccharide assembly protein LptE/RlpB
MRPHALLFALASAALMLLGLSGCGYHTLGAATHLPPDVKTLAVPVFATRTEASGTEQALTPLTYNASTQQSSSFVITIVASVTLTAHDGKVLFENDNYVFREQYQSSTNLPTFIQEDPAAIQRLSSQFARQLVADVLVGF